jgi:hypothetical protein
MKKRRAVVDENLWQAEVSGPKLNLEMAIDIEPFAMELERKERTKRD